MSLVLCSRVPLGANVEGVGSGVGDTEHSVGVIDGIRGAELWEEVSFNFVPQVEVFIGMDVLGEGLVRDGRT